MIQSKKRSPKRKSKKNEKSDFIKQILGLFLVCVNGFGLFKLGFVGISWDNLVRFFLGDVYLLGIIIFMIWGIYLLAFGKNPTLNKRSFTGFIICVLGVLLFLQTIYFQKLDINADFNKIVWQKLASDLTSVSLGTDVGGGILGTFLYSITYFLSNVWGSYFISLGLIFSGLCIFLRIPFKKVLYFLGEITKIIVDLSTKIGKKSLYFFNWSFSEIKKLVRNLKNKEDIENLEEIIPKESKDNAENDYEKTEDKNSKDLDIDIWNADNKVNDSTENNPTKILKSDVIRKSINPNYKLPPLDLLSDINTTDQSFEKKDMEKKKRVLEQTLKSFGVKAHVENTILGPSVTKYEIHPEIGVKVSKIVNLSDDLALALAAKDLRIEAPIPGKSLVGIEVPNINIATVSFKSIIREEKANFQTPLLVPLGRDISGKLISADLAKMPHLLIAGSTGSGKSVAINVIITSLLMNCTPEQVKLVLVDPKKVELGVYNDVAHLMTPVVTEPKKAAGALQKLVQEMERRYELFAATGQRNISGYNKMIKNQQKDKLGSDKLLPYIVIIVDELSDLMMTASNEVESAIVRLAQMARAAGIHMVLATQRPSVDVITGLIKANVPSRMAFAVSSGTDSRTIIDQNGAEKLLGRGDMLFLPMGLNKPIRVQGAFISDGDVEAVVNFVKQQQVAIYDENMEVNSIDLEKNQRENDKDPLFDEVLDFIRIEQKCSASLLQRRFKIGYNRAARLVESLAKEGIIGPQEGSRPRKVYLSKNNN